MQIDRQLRSLAVTMFLWLGVSVSWAYSEIVVFGDSLSDIGNTSAATFGITPGSKYWQGRFSNGRVWIERIAKAYNITLIRSRSGGTNYAYGGAESGTGNTSFIIPNMRSQVSTYLASKTPTSSTLCVIWIGGNDYMNGQTNTAVPVGNIGTAIQSLYARGARHFLIPNLPLLGEIPKFRGTATAPALNARTLGHNAALATRVSELKGSLAGSRIEYFDIQTLFAQVQANPGLYGLTNVTGQAILGTAIPDQFLFWDDVHPTRAGHGQIAAKWLAGKPAFLFGLPLR